MRLRFALIGVTLAALVVAVVAWRRGAERTPAPAESPSPPAAALSQTLVLPARAGFTTQVAYRHDGPPPWPRGNCFDLSIDRRGQDAPAYRVVNMHAENFAWVVDSLRLDAVEVLRLDDARCLVTDPRIPREWLLAAPCEVCTPPALRERLRESHVDRFRGR